MATSILRKELFLLLTRRAEYRGYACEYLYAYGFSYFYSIVDIVVSIMNFE
jgi:hypothetical protein